MRILSKEIDGKDSSGRIKLCAEESEDIYHAYNILEVGDSLRFISSYTFIHVFILFE